MLDLPGQMVAEKKEYDDFVSYGGELARAMAAQKFVQPPWHGDENCKPFVPDNLFKVDQVLLQVDAVQPSLRAKYTGPFQVLQIGDKVFTLQLPHMTDTVSIDQLVPFYT